MSRGAAIQSTMFKAASGKSPAAAVPVLLEQAAAGNKLADHGQRDLERLIGDHRCDSSGGTARIHSKSSPSAARSQAAPIRRQLANQPLRVSEIRTLSVRPRPQPPLRPGAGSRGAVACVDARVQLVAFGQARLHDSGLEIEMAAGYCRRTIR